MIASTTTSSDLLKGKYEILLATSLCEIEILWALCQQFQRVLHISDLIVSSGYVFLLRRT
jgi:hypothetical protein